MEISGLSFVAVASTGFIAGVINGTVGGGSLLTYPVLVAAGLPPVTAAATNTTGLATGNLFAVGPHIGSGIVNFREWRTAAAVTAIGALLGGLALILLPERIFEFIVPVLLIGASLTMFMKPPVVEAHEVNQAKTLRWLLASGLYNGYFGPGQGVLSMAILARDGRLSMRQVVIIKNFTLATSNVVVAALFVASGKVVWWAACTLLLTVAAGGWFGGSISHKISPAFLRYAVVAVGFVSAIWFIIS